MLKQRINRYNTFQYHSLAQIMFFPWQTSIKEDVSSTFDFDALRKFSFKWGEQSALKRSEHFPKKERVLLQRVT